MKTLAQEGANQSQHVLLFLAFPSALITQIFRKWSKIRRIRANKCTKYRPVDQTSILLYNGALTWYYCAHKTADSPREFKRTSLKTDHVSLWWDRQNIWRHTASNRERHGWRCTCSTNRLTSEAEAYENTAGDKKIVNETASDPIYTIQPVVKPVWQLVVSCWLVGV